MQVSNKDELIDALKNKKDDIEIKGDELVEEVRKILDKDRITKKIIIAFACIFGSWIIYALVMPGVFDELVILIVLILFLVLNFVGLGNLILAFIYGDIEKYSKGYYPCKKSNEVFSLQREHSKASPKEISTVEIVYISDNETRTSFVVDNKIGYIREKDFETWKNSNKIELNENVYVGAVLMKHPFLPNTYIDLNTSEDDIFKMKMEYIATICLHLGIKSFEGQAHFVSEEKRIISEKGGIGYKESRIDEEYKSEQERNYANKYKMKKTCSGDFSKKSYELAKKIAKETGLDKNLHLSQLIEQRNPNHINKEFSDELTTELSSELNDLTDIAFNLKIRGISLNASYSKRLEIKKKIEFDLKINF